MSERSVRIERLRLATPLDKGRARGLAEQTARKLLARLADDGLDARLGDLTVRVTPEQATDPARLAQLIAAEVRRRAR